MDSSDSPKDVMCHRDCTGAREAGEPIAQHRRGVTSEYSAHHRTNRNTSPAPTQPSC